MRFLYQSHILADNPIYLYLSMRKGNNLIKQIVPCNEKMYAVFREADGTESKTKILLFGLTDRSEIRPLMFSPENGIWRYTAPNDFENFLRYEMEGGKQKNGMFDKRA